jgi:tetratricopeptide (TPR) repeat protein
MHPPNAAELEALTEAFRQNPGSPAFVQLGDALIALGRPRDAVQVGARGLQANAHSIPGRMMVARAFACLHQWKEAQAELLKIVKTDRNHGPGFRLLGEVLMRRGDFERAVPVLQHAQNLSPADREILDLLRRARSSQPLGPPPPIPTPIAPARVAPPTPNNGHDEFADIPTRVAPEAYRALVAQLRGNRGPGARPQPPPQQPLGRMDLDQVQRPGPGGPQPPSELPVRHSDGRGDDSFAPRPLEMHQPPPAENPLAPVGQPLAAGPGARTVGIAPHLTPAVGREKRPSAAPRDASGQPVRPRVVSARRSEQAARESLRQSAAVGEQYLNNLLTAGLLDVPNVRVGEMTFDVNPDRRWGRSSARMFIFLFVIAGMAVAGVGTFYWYTEKQRAEDVAQHLATADELIPAATYADLDKALVEIRSALKRDPSSLAAIAMYAEAAGLNSLLYGEIPAGEVMRAVTAIKIDVADPSDQGFRSLLIARTAVSLAQLKELENDDAVTRLTAATVELREWLDKSPEDHLIRWLEGRALLAAGDRKGARAAFERAWKNGEGTVLAAIDLGDYEFDEGSSGAAMELYNTVLEKHEGHPLALVGRSLVRAEESRDRELLMKDVSIGLERIRGTRVGAYKQLAQAMTRYFFEDYDKFKARLKSAVNVEEPRFLARVALGHIDAGDLGTAAGIRDEIRWHSEKPQPHPLVTQVNAEIFWHTGDARAALETIGEQKGVRAASLRGRSLFDLGKHTEALAEFEAALEKAPKDLMLQTWAHATRLVLAKSRDDIAKAEEELNRLRLGAKSRSVVYPHGAALLIRGKADAARDRLESSIAEIPEADYHNPLEYRVRTTLATIDLAGGKIGEAATQLQEALKLNQGYLPALDTMGQLLAESDPAEALNVLKPVVAAEATTAGGDVAFARALLPIKTDVDKKAAADALRRAKKKGASDEAMAPVINEVDEDLFEELGVKPPKG